MMHPVDAIELDRFLRRMIRQEERSRAAFNLLRSKCLSQGEISAAREAEDMAIECHVLQVRAKVLLSKLPQNKQVGQDNASEQSSFPATE